MSSASGGFAPLAPHQGLCPWTPYLWLALRARQAEPRRFAARPVVSPSRDEKKTKEGIRNGRDHHPHNFPWRLESLQ